MGKESENIFDHWKNTRKCSVQQLNMKRLSGWIEKDLGWEQEILTLESIQRMTRGVMCRDGGLVKVDEEYVL
jgi:hypothetical protein